VAVCQRLNRPYSLAASLDVIAHEWGHGVVFSSAGWPYAGYKRALHEGFADVVAYAVEWGEEPPGDNAENAEWKYNEDNGGPDRCVDEDDGLLGYSYHAEDPPNPSYPHYAGNRLPVALRLSSGFEGGDQNPVCPRLPSLPGVCEHVTPIGVEKATSIFFRTLTWYCGATDDWTTLSDLAKQAAFDLYFDASPCYNAYPE
jgi:hypothetical protein